VRARAHHTWCVTRHGSLDYCCNKTGEMCDRGIDDLPVRPREPSDGSGADHSDAACAEDLWQITAWGTGGARRQPAPSGALAPTECLGVFCTEPDQPDHQAAHGLPMTTFLPGDAVRNWPVITRGPKCIGPGGDVLRSLNGAIGRSVLGFSAGDRWLIQGVPPEMEK